MRITVLSMVLLGFLLVIGLNMYAQYTLPVDSRKIAIQMNKGFSCMSYSPSADTLWKPITVPKGTVEVVLIPATGGIGVRADSTNANNFYATVPTGVPVVIPVYSQRTFYIRRAAAGTASVANLFFYKL